MQNIKYFILQGRTGRNYFCMCSGKYYKLQGLCACFFTKEVKQNLAPCLARAVDLVLLASVQRCGEGESLTHHSSLSRKREKMLEMENPVVFCNWRIKEKADWTTSWGLEVLGRCRDAIYIIQIPWQRPHDIAFPLAHGPVFQQLPCCFKYQLVFVLNKWLYFHHNSSCWRIRRAQLNSGNVLSTHWDLLKRAPIQHCFSHVFSPLSSSDSQKYDCLCANVSVRTSVYIFRYTHAFTTLSSPRSSIPALHSHKQDPVCTGQL